MTTIESAYTSETTCNDYDNDKKLFYGYDAYYDESTDMSGESEEKGLTYTKSVTFCTEDHKHWGTWNQTCHIRSEPIFKVLSISPLGDDVFTQTVQQIGVRSF